MEIGKTISILNAKLDFQTVLNNIDDKGVMLTSDEGHPVAVVLNFETFEAMKATIRIAANTEVNAAINRDSEAIRNGAFPKEELTLLENHPIMDLG
ncbi:type II toxin-antitoxin system Phd/YefM family antitoxin [Candidatus Entotheonella palauensis]|uniref:Antitoxin n=1 Tax=Candidatus Entotheonella gemina TaxID=1429439 RepID=W4L8X0_9BACT|nr:type II toxin-antitoxin system Phd/YefM family antitoxin [Candidatus Entotheonella palauensis]ETW94314.1 MAG: hypothetical protein ETSY2_49965 [Candidatus Entotheonella gemina]